MIAELKNRRLYPLWAVGVLGLATLVYFDLGPNLASNDDWMFAWSVKQLILGHGMLRVPDLAPLGVVQTLWAAAVTLGHVDYRLLRLSAVPFVVLACYCAFRLSRNLGADQFWAGVAGSSLLAAPIYLALATTFMSEVFYVGLLMAVALTCERWVSRGRMAPLCVVLVGICFLERQTAIYVPPAVTVGLLLATKVREVKPREWTYLAGLWLVVIGLLLAVQRAGLDEATSGRALSILRHPDIRTIFFSAMMFPGLLGLFSAPFMLGFVGRKAHPNTSAQELSGRPSRGRKVILGLLVLVIADAIVLTINHVPTLPGNYLTLRGLGPSYWAGTKPNLYPQLLWFSVELVSLASVVALLVGNRDQAKIPRLNAGVAFVVVLGALQLLPLAFGPIFDRYYLPALAPLLPVLAAAASSRDSKFGLCARAWAIGAMVAGIAIYAVGQQDYQAWHVAGNTAALEAFRNAPPAQVDGGFEINGVYTELPGYEAGGLPNRAPILDAGKLPSMVGPTSPRYRLMFAAANDPRDGVTYTSLAPGRIVITKVR